MLILLPVLLLLITAVLISLLGLTRPRFNYHWVLAVLASLAAWGSVWLLHSRMDTTLGELEGNYLGLALPAFSLHVDAITWPLALAISTMGLSVFLTDVGRIEESNWMIWAGDLGLVALGLTAVLAGNLSTMLLAWMIVDLIELGIQLRQLDEEQMRRRAYLFFAMNLLGTMTVFIALIAAGGAGIRMNLDRIPAEAQLPLILAAGLRMGVFPLQVAFLKEVHHQRGQGTLLRLVPSAVSLSLLAYTAAVQTEVELRTFLLFFAVLAAAYGGIVWFRAPDELRGRTYWIIGLAGMCIAAAIQGRPESVLAWGLVMLYAGTLLFLATVRTRWMIIIGGIAAVAISGLPLTPSSAGLNLFKPFNLLLVLLPVAHLLLTAGFVRYFIQVTEPLTGVEPWIKVVYIIGLAILPAAHFASFFLIPTVFQASKPVLWPLLVSLGLAGGGFLLFSRGLTIPDDVFLQLDKFFSLGWLFDLFGWLYGLLTRVVKAVNQLLEGDGGLLWMLVFLVMLISILGQLGGSGAWQ